MPAMAAIMRALCSSKNAGPSSVDAANGASARSCLATGSCGVSSSGAVTCSAGEAAPSPAAELLTATVELSGPGWSPATLLARELRSAVLPPCDATRCSA